CGGRAGRPPAAPDVRDARGLVGHVHVQHGRHVLVRVRRAFLDARHDHRRAVHADTDADANVDTDPNADADADADSYSYADSHADADADTDSYSYADSHADADA